MMWDSVLYGLFPVTHTETNINCTWKTVNLMEDALWSPRTPLVFQNKEQTPTECCRLAHSKVQDYVLRDAVKLGAAAAKAHGERPLSEVFLLKLNGCPNVQSKFTVVLDAVKRVGKQKGELMVTKGVAEDSSTAIERERGLDEHT
eukprot:g43679.t1